MSTKYGTVITTNGSAKLAACVLTGAKLNITHAAVGTGGGAYYVPSLDQEGLIEEAWRGEIASAEISSAVSNMIDVKFIIPDDVGGFTVREMGLFSEDGTLFAVCNTPDTEKVAISQGVTGKLTLVMHIIVQDASAVTFTVNPSLDTVSREDLDDAISAHNADPEAHEGVLDAILESLPEYIHAEEKGADGGVAGMKVIQTRDRDPVKPDYDLGGGGDDGTAEAVLLTGDYTGEAEIGVVVSGQEYDAENMSAQADTASDGTLIVSQIEE